MLQPQSTNSPQPLIRPTMPELDSVRGVAILGVLFLHGFYWQYSSLHFTSLAEAFLLATQPGWLGVNLFFVLSGFLITGILLDSKPKPRYYRRFYTRRALRILPAYYLLLAVLGLLHSASAGFLGLSFVYLSNVTGFFGVPSDYGPLWSLAVEEHYYIFWPAVVRNLTPKRLATCSIALCVLVPVLRATAFHYGYTTGLASYTWFVADGLAAGSLLAIVLRTSITRRQVVSLCAALLVGGAMLAVIGRPFGILTRDRVLGAGLQHTVIEIVFGGILLLVLLAGTSSRKRYVNNPGLRFLGHLSYGLYLIHLLVFRMYDKLSRHYWPQLQPSDGRFGLVVLRFLIAGGFAIGLAYLSRTYFEERFLQLKDRLTPAVSDLQLSVATSSEAPPQEIPA